MFISCLWQGGTSNVGEDPLSPWRHFCNFRRLIWQNWESPTAKLFHSQLSNTTCMSYYSHFMCHILQPYWRATKYHNHGILSSADDLYMYLSKLPCYAQILCGHLWRFMGGQIGWIRGIVRSLAPDQTAWFVLFVRCSFGSNFVYFWHISVVQSSMCYCTGQVLSIWISSKLF